MTVESDCQDRTTTIRVLLPGQLEEGRRYPVLYVLPVEAADGSPYGDGLREVKKLGLHERYGRICVQPTVSRLPLYADRSGRLARAEGRSTPSVDATGARSVQALLYHPTSAAPTGGARKAEGLVASANPVSAVARLQRVGRA